MTTAAVASPSFLQQEEELAAHEAVIARGLATFVAVGQALLTIRDAALFRAGGYLSFAAYCAARWGLSRPRTYQLMDAATTVGMLSTNVDSGPTPLPDNEAQARALTPLQDDEAALVAVWREVRAEHGDAVTADKVRLAVERQLRSEQVQAQRQAAQAARAARARPAARSDPFADLPYNRIVHADARDYLAALPAACVDLCLTSPPYWAQRQVSADPRELGPQVRPESYLALLQDICRAMGRVLRSDGWLLLNVGDTYASQPGGYRGDPARPRALSVGGQAAAATATARQWDVPDKSLCLIPWRLLTALTLEGGWVCRNILVWDKRGHQPEAVTDRLTQSWEPVFALTRSQYPYFWRDPERARRNVDLWSIPVGRQGRAQGHPAPFPDELVERAIRHYCPPHGVVLDPFAGSGTVLAVAQALDRRFLGCDLVDWEAD